MNAVRITPQGAHAATLTPPISKSDALRALVLADIAGAPATLPPRGEQPSDVRVMVEGLRHLRENAGAVELDCADGGAPFRFLLAQAALPPARRVTLRGTPRLGERPREALLAALADALGEGGFRVVSSGWPLVIEGAQKTQTPRFEIEAVESGQFASSLLLAAARLARAERRPWEVRVKGQLPSEGYVALTVDWIRRAGFTVDAVGPGAWSVASGGEAGAMALPGDWSSLGYLLALAWRTGSTVERVDLASLHPDRAMARCLEQLGAKLVPLERGLQVTGALRGELRASGHECPDLLPTLAALACGAQVTARLDDVEILRAKESDRVAGIERLVSTFGGETRLEGGTLYVSPPSEPPRAVSFDPVADHRLAMSATVAAVLLQTELTLLTPDCVEKSFPTFWSQVARLGVQLTGLD